MALCSRQQAVVGEHKALWTEMGPEGGLQTSKPNINQLVAERGKNDACFASVDPPPCGHVRWVSSFFDDAARRTVQRLPRRQQGAWNLDGMECDTPVRCRGL
jgi:hypothetical protein